MGYLYLAFALTGGLVKGFSGKKISRDVAGFKDSIFVNLIRMVLCAVIGAVLLLLENGAEGFAISGNEIVICIASAVFMSTFCVAWMCAYQNEAYMFLSVFTMLGSIVTCMLGLFMYSEPISLPQWCGIGILLVAVFVMSKYNKDFKGKKFKLQEIVILVVGCLGASLSDFSQKVFVIETGRAPATLNFYTYAIGGVLLAVVFTVISLKDRSPRVTGELLNVGNALGYIGISAFLYLNSICKTMAVREGLSTAEIYPVLNGANLIASAILASILFKEKITKKSIIGMALAFIGVVLINLF